MKGFTLSTGILAVGLLLKLSIVCVSSVLQHQKCSTSKLIVPNMNLTKPSVFSLQTFLPESIPTGLGKKLTSALPPFAPVNARDPLCRNHSRIYLQELEKFSLWALKMHDATAKLPSGILNGNVNQLGDFDQCLEIHKKFAGDEIKGQYCLTSIQVRLHSGHGPTIEQIYSLVQSHSAFRSNLEDPGHRVPRFSSINWAVCVPSSCGAADVEESLMESLEHHLGPTGLRIQVQVTPEMCQVQQESNLPPNSSLLVLGFFLIMLGVACAATILEYGMKDQPPANKMMEILLSFSFISNCKKLFSLDRPQNDIPSIHGIRTLNAMMLLVAHKSMALFFIPYVNRTAMSECLGRPWTIVGRAASLYTDPFIMLSGLLTSYAFLRHLNRSQALDIPKEILSRIMRLVPTLSALILFCTFILPVMGSGPMWNLVIRHHAELCKVSWWRNLLFIHNYFGFKNMCLTHTHHVGIDTQLFIISPILVKVLWRWPKPGLIALLILAMYSTILRFYVTYAKQLSLFLYFGNPISQMFNTADFSYILPTHRLSVYIIGVLLGYGLHYWGRDYKMKTGHLTFGWFIALVLLYQSLLGPAKMGDRNYVYNRMDAANYAAFAPITWCLFFAWIIFCGYTGNGGFLTKFFSWKGFLICTRLSYSFYLTQFPVFFYYVGLLRAPIHYSFFLLLDIKEFTVIIIASVILTLMFEMPFQNIRSILLKKSSSTTVSCKKPLSARL